MEGNHAMANPRIVDLTVSEFRALVRETVIQSVTELLGDPDEGLAVRDDFAEQLRRSLAEVDAGGRTTNLSEIVDRSGSSG